MLGIALGVAALIIVLSVMNGFQKEVRDRMLGVVSHIEVYQADGQALPDLQQTLREARTEPEVIGAAPFVAGQGLLARGEDMKGVMVRGIDPALEPQVSDFAGGAQGQVLNQLQPGGFGAVLGSELARSGLKCFLRARDQGQVHALPRERTRRRQSQPLAAAAHHRATAFDT